jgi:hypothetical protein
MISGIPGIPKPIIGIRLTPNFITTIGTKLIGGEFITFAQEIHLSRGTTVPRPHTSSAA